MLAKRQRRSRCFGSVTVCRTLRSIGGTLSGHAKRRPRRSCRLCFSFNAKSQTSVTSLGRYLSWYKFDLLAPRSTGHAGNSNMLSRHSRSLGRVLGLHSHLTVMPLHVAVTGKSWVIDRGEYEVEVGDQQLLFGLEIVDSIRWK